MIDNRINYTMVGGFVLLLFGSLFALLLVLGGRGGGRDAYYTYYNHVGGLKYGTQVLYEGFQVGQVEEIIPEHHGPKTRYKVMLSVRDGWDIPRDSVARVTATGFLSAVAIDITGGTDEKTIPVGGEIPGQAGGNMFAALSSVAGEVGDLSRQGLRPLLDALTRVVASLGDVASTQVPAIAQNLKSMSDELAKDTPRIAGNIAGFSDKLNQGVMSDNNMKSFQRVLSNAETASAQFSDISQNLNAMSQDVRSLSGQLDAMVKDNKTDLRDSVKDMRYSLDALSRNIDSITYNLDSTSRNMSEFSRSIRQNPGLLLSGKPPEDEAKR